MFSFQRGGLTEPGKWYRKVLAGDTEDFSVKKRGHMLGLMAMEAYRCWIENDVAGGKELCSAIENIADFLMGEVKPGGPGLHAPAHK